MDFDIPSGAERILQVLTEAGPYEITTWRTEGPYSDDRRPDHVRFVPDLEQDLARREILLEQIEQELSDS